MWTEEQEKRLKELEKTQHDFWNISHQTANFLNMLIKICNVQNMVEIGTSNGYSGLWFANALKQTGGKLTTIEYYEKRIVLAKANFEKFGYDDIITIKQGSACEVLEELDGMYDFIFIDANKREYVKNFEIMNPKLKHGGIIAADNINSHREKVQTFIDAVDAHPDYQFEILDLPAGLLLARKS